MRKISKYTSVMAGFIGGAAFIVGCGNESVVSAAQSLWNDVGSALYYTSGNVGIGTSDPKEKLEVSGNILFKGKSNSSIYLTQENKSLLTLKGDIGDIDPTTFDPNKFVTLTLGSGGPHSIASIISGQDVNYWSSYLGFVIRRNDDSSYTARTEAMRITSDANVGIGTTTPVSRLAVSGLPTSAPDTSGNAGVVCATNEGNFWLDNDGNADCQ